MAQTVNVAVAVTVAVTVTVAGEQHIPTAIVLAHVSFILLFFKTDLTDNFQLRNTKLFIITSLSTAKFFHRYYSNSYWPKNEEIGYI